jgi:hypothetical protein
VSEPGAGSAHDTNHVVIVTADDAVDVPMADKHAVAAAVLASVERVLAATRGDS